MGFMVGNVLHTVRPAQNPQFLPDEALESAGFDLAVDHGVLSIVHPQLASVVADNSNPQKKDKKSRKGKPAAAQSNAEEASESEESDELDDSKDGEEE
jgi:hypothetical protein